MLLTDYGSAYAPHSLVGNLMVDARRVYCVCAVCPCMSMYVSVVSRVSPPCVVSVWLSSLVGGRAVGGWVSGWVGGWVGG
jgi:hypothetical protein